MIYSKVEMEDRPIIIPKKKESLPEPQNEENVITCEITPVKYSDGSSFSGILYAATVIIAGIFAFLFGCAVTDETFSSVVVSINTASSGKLPVFYSQSYQEPAETPADNTVYERYRPDSSYLMTEEQYEYKKEVPEEIAVGTENHGAALGDGGILLPVMSKNISAYSIFSLTNETDYSPNLEYLTAKMPKALENIAADSGEPLVLIIHTHGTESYNSENTDGYYNPESPTRSDDISENVVAVGKVVTEVLENFGIPVIHSEKMCDKDSFIYAYNTSKKEVAEILKEYPSIKIVIDLHRDSITASDGTKTKPVFSYAGENTAQLMFVVGTDEAGANHPNWEENLSFALYLQKEISEDAPGLFRPINLRSASFNEQLSPGYLLLECGSCANSFEEAERAAKLFATGLARVLKN